MKGERRVREEMYAEERFCRNELSRKPIELLQALVQRIHVQVRWQLDGLRMKDVRVPKLTEKMTLGLDSLCLNGL